MFELQAVFPRPLSVSSFVELIQRERERLTRLALTSYSCFRVGMKPDRCRRLVICSLSFNAPAPSLVVGRGVCMEDFKSHMDRLSLASVESSTVSQPSSFSPSFPVRRRLSTVKKARRQRRKKRIYLPSLITSPSRSCTICILNIHFFLLLLLCLLLAHVSV